MTSLPPALIDAVTNAPLELMALIRSPTVSLPVDAYLVMFVPSLTLNVPPGRKPRVDSGVLTVTGTVPVPVAGAPAELAVLELEDAAEEDPLALLDDDEDVELPEGSSAACTAATNWELTRVRAWPLAMAAKPFPRFVSACAITLMSAASASATALCACAFCQ